jgi:hypothetical protein
VSGASVSNQPTTLGTTFLTALMGRDFERLQTCFADHVYFRALVPSGMREGHNAIEATNWFRRWFNEAEEFQLLTASTNQISDRLHIAYRIRIREKQDWELVEQQAYCAVHSGLIDLMHLLCSGFRPDFQHPSEEP